MNTLSSVRICYIFLASTLLFSSSLFGQSVPTPMDVIGQVGGDNALAVNGIVNLRQEFQDDQYKSSHGVDVAVRRYSVALNRPERVVADLVGQVDVIVRRYPTVRDCVVSSQTRLTSLKKGKSQTRHGLSSGYANYRPLGIGDRAGQALQVADVSSPTSARYLAEFNDWQQRPHYTTSTCSGGCCTRRHNPGGGRCCRQHSQRGCNRHRQCDSVGGPVHHG